MASRRGKDGVRQLLEVVADLVPELARAFEAAFAEIARAGLQSSIKTFDGAYVRPDPSRMRRSISHDYGLAIDLNASTNQLGKNGDMDPRIVEIFQRHAFTWGGDAEIPDPMCYRLSLRALSPP